MRLANLLCWAKDYSDARPPAAAFAADRDETPSPAER
jgi:hypothetical protein